MAVDVQALKDAPPDDTRALELIEQCRSRLGGEWRLLRSSIKLSKAFFEADYEGRSVIGKVSKSKRAQTAFDSLQKLWHAGMRSPQQFTVPEPIAWFEDLKLLIQEKAPGQSLTDCFESRTNCTEHVRRAAEWLKHLQESRLSLRIEQFDHVAAMNRSAELAAAIGDPSVAATATSAIRVLQDNPMRVTLSHGDFHPMNLYVSPDRVTGIDLDTLAMRDPEADVGYFLAQTANFGLLLFDRLDETRQLRDVFSASFPDLNPQRVAAHIGWALLQSLHYDACILKVKNDKASLMIQAARAALQIGSLDAAEP